MIAHESGSFLEAERSLAIARCAMHRFKLEQRRIQARHSPWRFEMHPRTILIATVLATLTAASTLAGAVDSNEGKDAPAGKAGMAMDKDHGMMHGGTTRGGMMQGGMMQGGMMQGGMMQGGMMDMMGGCKQMMGSPATYQLPPGNEKLQLQMQAEMMQKMGEILSRYADKAK